jgi:hypothetical protein
VLRVPIEREEFLYTNFGNGKTLDPLGKLQYTQKIERMLELMPDLVMVSGKQHVFLCILRLHVENV